MRPRALFMWISGIVILLAGVGYLGYYYVLYQPFPFMPAPSVASTILARPSLPLTGERIKPVRAPVRSVPVTQKSLAGTRANAPKDPHVGVGPQSAPAT